MCIRDRLKYIQAAMQAGVEMGIYPKDGMRMVAQSVKGAAELILNMALITYNHHSTSISLSNIDPHYS